MEYKQFREQCIKEQNRGKRKKYITFISLLLVVGIIISSSAVVTKINNNNNNNDNQIIYSALPVLNSIPNNSEIFQDEPVPEPKFIGDYETPVIYFLRNEAEVRDITAESAILYDIGSSTVLYEKNSNKTLYPASLTKLLTAAVAMNVCRDKNIVFEVGDELMYVEPDASSAYLVEGEKLTLEMLIDGLLLPSGGDAAYVIAANVGRYYADDKNLSTQEAIDTFVELMNLTAEEIGAANSHFVTPDGYHNEEHYTTAVDMLKISLYSMSFPVIRQSVGKTYAYYTIVSGEEHTWYNSNYLLSQNSPYYYSKARGLKTGYTDQAGQCLSAYAVDGDKEVIAIVFKSDGKSNRFGDAEILMEDGFEYLSNQT